MAGDPTQLQVWLARAAAALAALPLGTLLVAILVEGEASAGEALLAVVVVVAAIALAAAPLAFRRRGPFRAAAATGAVVYLGAGLVLAIVGGIFLWPAGLLLAVAAAVPVGWPLRKVLLAGVLAGAALVLVPLGVFGAYTCLSPTPTLDVTFTTQREANRFARSATGYTALESVGGGGAYRIEFERGDTERRDAVARRLERAGHAVRTADDRCG